MHRARVLIVDDSLTMRALFSGVLERAKDIDVVGMAGSADEARRMIADLKPNVLTLDVEMPGMNGIDFLEEIMTTQPMPVIMLSTLTQKGAATTLRALELGALECFPKPMKATPEEFNKLAPKLSALVLAAANGAVRKPGEAVLPPAAPPADYVANGKVLAMSASTGGVDAVRHLLKTFPATCPPTLIVLQLEPGISEMVAASLDGEVAPTVLLAANDMPLRPGHVYLVADTASHAIVDRWPDAHIRLVPNDPVGGVRPSASLLYATLAKTAARDAVGMVLTGMGKDGAAGLKALRTAGGLTLCQTAATATVAEAPEAALAADAVERALPLAELAAAALEHCRQAA